MSVDELTKKSLPDLIPGREERESFINKVRDLRRVGDIEVTVPGMGREHAMGTRFSSGDR